MEYNITRGVVGRFRGFLPRRKDGHLNLVIFRVNFCYLFLDIFSVKLIFVKTHSHGILVLHIQNYFGNFEVLHLSLIKGFHLVLLFFFRLNFTHFVFISRFLWKILRGRVKMGMAAFASFVWALSLFCSLSHTHAQTHTHAHTRTYTHISLVRMR